MIAKRGEIIVIEGEMTLDSVPGMVAALDDFFVAGAAHQVDLSGVGEVDSSAVALLLEWQRQAAGKGCSLRWISVPPSLENLAKLYGVQELLPLAA